ncbi:MAG: hypothetical protein HOO67_08050 [Candidatus Peribacteraceae bacterium]|nr:hypothetical protein [Candidatus Peribacteraceae bacterium]
MGKLDGNDLIELAKIVDEAETAVAVQQSEWTRRPNAEAEQEVGEGLMRNFAALKRLFQKDRQGVLDTLRANYSFSGAMASMIDDLDRDLNLIRSEDDDVDGDDEESD